MEKEAGNTTIKVDQGLPEIVFLKSIILTDPTTDKPLMFTYYFYIKDKPKDVMSACVSFHEFNNPIETESGKILGRLVTRIYKTIQVEIEGDLKENIEKLKELLNVGKDSVISYLDTKENSMESFPHRTCEEMKGNVVIGALNEIEATEENIEDLKNIKDNLPWLGSSTLPGLLNDLLKF